MSIFKSVSSVVNKLGNTIEKSLDFVDTSVSALNEVAKAGEFEAKTLCKSSEYEYEQSMIKLDSLKESSKTLL